MFSILYEEQAEQDLRRVRPFEQRQILDDVDRQLKLKPATPSQRRKILAGLVPPWSKLRPVWQLRVGNFRVFYDVDERRHEVIVRAVRRKGRKTTKEIL